jgi:Serine carboxypeptidase
MNQHPETKILNWYFAGEAMGSKTVTALAYQTVQNNKKIHLGNLEGTLVNLAGIIIGNGVFNGLIQTMSMVLPAGGNYSKPSLLIDSSFVAPYQMDQLITLSIHCENNANNSKIAYGSEECNNMGSYIRNVSGIDPNAIILTVNQTSALLKSNTKYLNNQDVYTALNVANSHKNGSKFDNLNMQASKAIDYQLLNKSLTYINFALANMPCLIFDGAFDIMFGTAGTSSWLSQLNSPYSSISNVSFYLF